VVDDRVVGAVELAASRRSAMPSRRHFEEALAERPVVASTPASGGIPGWPA
jgi:hypothetical protein